MVAVLGARTVPGFGLNLAVVLNLISPYPDWSVSTMACDPNEPVARVNQVRAVFMHMPSLAMLYFPMVALVGYWHLMRAHQQCVHIACFGKSWSLKPSPRWLLEAPLVLFVLFLIVGVWCIAVTVSDTLPFLQFRSVLQKSENHTRNLIQ